MLVQGEQSTKATRPSSPWYFCVTTRFFRLLILFLGPCCLLFSAVPNAAARDQHDVSLAVPSAQLNPDVLRLPVIEGNDIRFTHITTTQGLSQQEYPVRQRTIRASCGLAPNMD
jgi:hypothetical protein